ncbi:MAG: metallophosphoesterase, partial [Acidobacteria bacterium]|nr:metallophosphoesterase [Acidobacteriota bacterium]
MATVQFCVMGTMLALFLASQLFWFRRVAALGQWLIPNPKLRRVLAGGAAVAYIFAFAYMFAWSRDDGTPVELTVRVALLEAPFFWWVAGSVMGFGLYLIYWAGNRALRAATWVYQAAAMGLKRARQAESQALASPSRRRFFEQTAMAASTVPFVASAYGIFYGRVNLEITRKRIHLPRLPKAFQGFRIVQLSDIHIGPFMPAEEIRQYVAMANELQPDLIALTGDFITWDPDTQEPVVEALEGLRAPYGVVGCLGNHELWYDVEDSITQLFARRGVRILRQENMLLR